MNEHALEYIKIQWADIHHSRHQEWKALSVIGAVFLAIVSKVTLSGTTFVFQATLADGNLGQDKKEW